MLSKLLHSREPATSFGLLVLRVSFGCFMLVHGWPKLMGFSQMADKFPDPLGMGSQLSLVAAVGAEVGCSILLILGLGTRLAAIPLAFTMIVALFMVHGADPWQVKEKAALYLAVYVVLVFTGSGRFSVDHCLWGNREEEIS
ncbi:DoxX family protein [Adhaeretor mobilis]|uniref:DoxX n=1 Tax=Adhaeretor mobilis TaxID=1930276 RepID=A0A517MSR7_9BACT|nr:DoxX family protein [Adhaeretor mobilis]QDS97931.1 DoxX [Adhaeretor mobilis]